MARVMVVALACCAVRAQAEQYGGGALPQYGAPDYERGQSPDEYRNQSPDAPAPLDYKYEEEPPGETEKPHKYVDNVERWWKSPRIQRRPLREDGKEELELQGFDIDRKSNHPWPRKKTRGRREKVRRVDTPPPRRRITRYGRAMHDNEDANYIDNVDYRDYAVNNLENDDRSPLSDATAKIIRRKPRDRVFAPAPPAPPGEESIRDEISEQNQQMKPDRPVHDKSDELEYSSGIESEGDESDVRVRPLMPIRDLIRKNTTMLRGTPKHNVAYQDYTDYSNMRQFNIKSDIPLLLRRTTTSRLRAGGRTSPVELVQALWPARRAMTELGLPSAASAAPTASASSPVWPPSADPTPLEPATSTTAGATPTPESGDTTELSLAEKSRLSILKKAKLKERVKESATKKPPVLLRVTSRLPTVVMVEPPTSADPWLRAREVAGDSPHTLEKVKRLMRQKLVANAKSIRDLTDDWDDTVCDYIDVSMLQNRASTSAPPTVALYICLFMCCPICTSILIVFL